MGNFFRSILILALTGCTSLVYQPDKYLHAHPDQFKVDFNILTIPTTDNIKLSAWKLKSKKPAKNLVLFFHGNAQNITSHFVNLYWLTEFETDVIIFDYRDMVSLKENQIPKG